MAAEKHADLHALAAERGFSAHQREITRGRWVWDIRDEAGRLGVIGVRKPDALEYLRAKKAEAARSEGP